MLNHMGEIKNSRSEQPSRRSQIQLWHPRASTAGSAIARQSCSQESNIFFQYDEENILHCMGLLGITTHVILLIINQMLLIEADAGLLNGLVLDLLNFKE